MARKSALRITWLLPFLPVAVGVFLLFGDALVLQSLRNSLFDQYQRWQPRTFAEAPVRIVDIDDESLARLGQWPWPRTRLAELVDRLGAAGAAAVGFDVIFAEPDRTSPLAAADLWQIKGGLREALVALPDHDRVFAESVARGDVVVGFAVDRGKEAKSGGDALEVPPNMGRFIFAGEPPGRWLHPFDGIVGSLPALSAAAKGNGALTFVPDGDGVVRRVPLVLQVAGQPVSTLVAETLRVGQGVPNVILKSAGPGAGLAEMRIADVTIPTTPQGEIWVHYSPPVPGRYLPAWQVMAGKVPQELVEGHLILVGSSAQGLMDLRFNTLGRVMPGVEAHAQALEQILTGHYLQRPGWARGLEALLLVVAGLGVGFLTLRVRALFAAGAALAVVGAILYGGWHAFSAEGLLIDTATPVIVALFTFVLCSVVRHFASEREQRWIKEAFARYVSPNRVSHLVDHPEAMELGGRRQECSFIFTDLASFTSLMEKIDPGEAVALLNTYLDEMIAIAFKHDGTLDRIVGDAVAIMFSAPVPQADHRSRALACALEMDAFASRYSRDLQAKGIAFGKTRIGVHGGEVIVGNFGGSNIFDYRALGDPVNTAARLESVNKHLGTRMCVSEDTLRDCPDAVVRPVGRLVLKGKTQALAVFEPVVDDPAIARAPLADYRAAYAVMAEGQSDAAARFEALAKDFPDDPLVGLHLGRLHSGASGDLIVMSEK
ncbi:MAG: adenylate/guanylate cyclase domain-containing protein [Betaproteobacteria bacterium]|nr:adenylate/guanylate cyclase domain-containing protein [Betaproteobacteria bacterium]